MDLAFLQIRMDLFRFASPGFKVDFAAFSFEWMFAGFVRFCWICVDMGRFERMPLDLS